MNNTIRVSCFNMSFDHFILIFLINKRLVFFSNEKNIYNFLLLYIFSIFRRHCQFKHITYKKKKKNIVSKIIQKSSSKFLNFQSQENVNTFLSLSSEMDSKVKRFS